MNASSIDTFSSVFPTCRRTLGSITWGRVLASLGSEPPLQPFAADLERLTPALNLPGFIADLARVEWTLHQKRNADVPPLSPAAETGVNPTLTVLPVQWHHLPTLVRSDMDDEVPIHDPAHIMIWHHPQSHALNCREAASVDLLALKLVLDKIDPKEAPTLGPATPGELKMAIDAAISQGILLPGASRLRRPHPADHPVAPAFSPMRTADLFTLQWHITQACDLHCRHCYDRSDRSAMSKDTALAVLADFHDFCHRQHVHGQVTFTGGNPFLYPHLESVYRAATDWGFGIAILGNPTPARQLRRLVDIAMPRYVQISLEGLQPHNDYMRGSGHFERSLRFLRVLRELGIFSMVMLTLTRDNIDQVLPLADRLRGLADQFTFNRLATVGEGANLQMPEKKQFQHFLEAYADKAASHPHMGLKDNLFNILRHDRGEPPFGGCTGYGCGAAFNFMALLPDGDVHACRKFPSPIGSMRDQRLEEIYNGPLAQRYRAGSRECRTCELNWACRGCLAVTHSLGLDVFRRRDPYCFAPEAVRTGVDIPPQT